MYAIISDGGRQYRVEEGLMFEIERKDLAEGTETLEFEHVLVVGDLEEGTKIGQPTVEGAKVVTSVLGEVKGEKLVIQKYRRRKHSASKTGHRQRYLHVKVEKIEH